MTLRRLTDEVVVARSDEAEGAEFRRHEGRDVRRIGLRRVARAVNHVIHGDQNAAALRLRIRRELHGVQEIDRAVSRNGGSRTHGADNHDRLIAVNREVQEVSGFFQRIRAVRNHDSGHVRIGEQLVAALGKLQPDLVRHVFRADIGNLLTGHLGVLLDLRDRVDQNLNTQVAGLIARHLSAAGSRTGNRAARGKNLDLGQCLSANSNGKADRESDQFVTEMHDVTLQFKIR